jgi:hypothetical protein
LRKLFSKFDYQEGELKQTPLEIVKTGKWAEIEEWELPNGKLIYKMEALRLGYKVEKYRHKIISWKGSTIVIFNHKLKRHDDKRPRQTKLGL